MSAKLTRALELSPKWQLAAATTGKPTESPGKKANAKHDGHQASQASRGPRSPGHQTVGMIVA